MVKSKSDDFMYKLYSFIAAMQAEKQRSPSLSELINAGFATSTSVIRHYLVILEQRGLIERDPYVARGIRVVAEWPGPQRCESEQIQKENQ